MSTYEDYSEGAAGYDATRVPIGIEILLGAIARAGTPLHEVRLLDAGCGTGAYSEALAPHLGHVDAIDINAGMLSLAMERLHVATARKQVAVHQGSIDVMAFEDASFDAVMFNQVLHHLESGEDDSFRAHRRALAEARRVLRPGGVTIVNATSPAQLRDGFWYAALIPEAATRMTRHLISDDALEATFEALNFEPLGRFVPLDAVMQGAAYFDPDGPLNPVWRQGDSLWALASEGEIAAALARLEAWRAGDAFAAFFRRHEASRRRVGQITFHLARRR